jgi:DNA-binding transcriptional LysR family regulator
MPARSPVRPSNCASASPPFPRRSAELEDWLGVRLLLRSTHRLTPTEAGRNFYGRAKRAIEEADEAELAARDAATTLSGRLRFCGPLTFTRLLVMPRSISMLFSRIATLTSLPRASTWRC